MEKRQISFILFKKITKGGRIMSNILIEDDLSLLMIGENLKRLRVSHGLSTTEVAKMLNKSRQGYFNYETGAREINITSLVTLSNYYGVSIDSIVGNPYAIGVESKLNYRTFELTKEGIKKTMPTVISSQYNDILAVKISDIVIKFFWRTDTYVEDSELLFEFKDRYFISKIWFKPDGSGFFNINDKPVYFTKRDKEDLIYLGVLSSTLNKQFNIKNFF